MVLMAQQMVRRTRRRRGPDPGPEPGLDLRTPSGRLLSY